MHIIKKIAFLSVLIGNSSVFAQQIVTDRPDQTEASSTVPKSSLQVESGILVGYEGKNQNAFQQLLLPSTLFRYGIGEKIELRFVNQVESLRNLSSGTEIRGISDLEIGTKIQIFQKEGVNTEIAFLTHLILPVGSEFISGESFGTVNKLALSHSMNEQVEIGYNVGYNHFGNNSSLGDLTYSLALGIGITDKIGLYVEPYGDIIELETLQANFDAGFTYLYRSNIQFDFSWGTGLNHTMNYVSVGGSWNFKR